MLFRRAVRFGLLGLGLLPAACVPAAGAPVAPSAAAPDAPAAPDMRVITAEQAADAGLAASDLKLTFPDASDGTTMLTDWIAAARARGASRVGDIALYVVKPHDDALVECRSLFYPERTSEPHVVPGGVRFVSVTRPVLRSVTHYEYRCHMVSKPVQHMETTYTQQYNSFSKSYQSVPQTHTVTRYEMQNECRFEPQTRLETHREYTLASQYVPPRVEYLARMRLKETEPACYVPAGDEATSRVEGKIFLAQGDEQGHGEPAR
jgi:hypothetical protein